MPSDGVQKMALCEEVQLLTGADGHAMLFHRSTKRYVRLSALGAKIVTLLDGTRSAEDIAELLTSIAPDNEAKIRASLDRFVTDLAGAGVLRIHGSAPVARRWWPPNDFSGPWAPRIVLFRDVNGLAEALRGLFIRVPGKVGLGLVVSLSTASAVAVVTVLSHPTTHGRPSGVSVLSLLTALFFHAVLHEISHIGACGLMGAPVREVGLMLWLRIVPMAYVDHTDSYRLVRRGARTTIAVAGPVFDLIAAGVTSIVVLFASPYLAPTAKLILMMQLSILTINCNPLLPTDAYHVLAALSGEINLRSRAFHLLLNWATRRPLPAALSTVTRVRLWAYAMYAVLAVAYTIGMFTYAMWASASAILRG